MNLFCSSSLVSVLIESCNLSSEDKVETFFEFKSKNSLLWRRSQILSNIEFEINPSYQTCVHLISCILCEYKPDSNNVQKFHFGRIMSSNSDKFSKVYSFCRFDFSRLNNLFGWLISLFNGLCWLIFSNIRSLVQSTVFTNLWSWGFDFLDYFIHAFPLSLKLSPR